MTASFTEGKHPGEFLLSEANGTLSRETITILSGVKFEDGEVFQLSGGKATTKDATVNTAGAFVTKVEGVIIGNPDASAATGTNADILGWPYIRRLAEVKASALKLPSGKETLAKSDLATTYNIVAR